jgi:hypothetical protein
MQARVPQVAITVVFILPLFVLAVRAAFVPREQIAAMPIPDRA